MQLRSPPASKIAIDMTPMIDIVFQLLIFFILTLQIAAPEGDFQVRMPQLGTAAAPATRELPPLLVRLVSDRQGNLWQIQLNGQTLASFDELQQTIERGLGGDARLTVAEVEIASDYDLSYEHTMAAITAISGRIDQRGQIVKLIERIRFKSPE
jgi:biopolymer transport protein ExbD